MKLTGPLYGLLAFCLYSSHDAVIKALGGTYSPFQIVFFSSLFSFPLITLMLMWEKTASSLIPVHPWWMLVRTMASSLTAVSIFYAFSVLPLTQVYVILFATPLIITLLAVPMLGEKVGLMRFGAVTVGLAGVIIALDPQGTELSIGHAAALIGAVFSGVAAIIVRKIGREERTVVMMIYPLLANFLIMGIAMAFVYTPLPAAHLGGMALISALGFIAGISLIAAYRHGDALSVAPMQYSQFLWATLFGALFFHESIEQSTLIGGAIIILSGLFILYREARLGDNSTRPVSRTRSRGPTAASFRISTLLRKRNKPQ